MTYQLLTKGFDIKNHMPTVYCVDCGKEFEPNPHNELEGLKELGIESQMCDSCLMADSENFDNE